MAEILLPPMTRLAIAVTGITGSPDVRERLRLAEAEDLGEAEAKWLSGEIDTLADLLAR